MVVSTRTCMPVNDCAGTPRALSAIASKAIDTCSPVVERHVELSYVRLARDLLGEIDQTISGVAHRGDHDGDLIATFTYSGNTGRDPVDQVNRADGGPAVLLNDQHGRKRLRRSAACPGGK